jgi:hypothetical protein
MDGMSVTMDAMVMRTGLTAVNVTMLTSSSGMRCRVKIKTGARRLHQGAAGCAE